MIPWLFASPATAWLCVENGEARLSLRYRHLRALSKATLRSWSTRAVQTAHSSPFTLCRMAAVVPEGGTSSQSLPYFSGHRALGTHSVGTWENDRAPHARWTRPTGSHGVAHAMTKCTGDNVSLVRSCKLQNQELEFGVVVKTQHPVSELLGSTP